MFGSYMVPLKKWPKYSSWAYLSMMTLGALLSALVVAFYTDTFNVHPVGLLCGLLWVAGGAFCFWAVQAEADLAGAGVRSMGVSILASFLSGVLLFGEQSKFFLSIPAIACFLIGLSRLSPSHGGSVFKNWRSLLGGLAFGSYLIPYKLSVQSGLSMTDVEFLCPFTIGLFVGSQILIAIIEIRRKKMFDYARVPSLVTILMGVLWMVLLVNLGWGVFVFGEYKTTRERIKLLLATFIILAGAVLLTLSKG